MGKSRFTVAAIAVASAATAQAPRVPSSFAIASAAFDPRAVLTARPRGTLLSLTAKPARAVALEEAIEPEPARLIGVKGAAGVERGRVLYGWPERPGFYCDLLRNSGLGAGGFCLIDRDRDGRFDTGQRVGFNSARADLLLLTPSGKIIGAQIKGDPVALPRPIRYARRAPPATAVGKLEVTWSNDRGSNAIRIGIGTPDNHTATAGVGESYLLVPQGKLPLTVDLYGIRINLRGFDEKGGLRYSIQSLADDGTVPLVFVGHVLIIIPY